jgi:two-component system chemotaxis sensor kinase CheA
MATQELLQDYVAEVQEHLLDMEKSLLLLEQEGANQEQIAQVFRAAHSIKGASACMGFEGLTTLTHELESLISAVQNSARSVPSSGISLLLGCVDLIAGAVDHVKREGAEPSLDPSVLENLRTGFFADEADSSEVPQEVPAEPGGNGPEIVAEAGGVDEQAVPCFHEDQQLEAAIEVEDEELLTIFVNSFRENYFQLLGLLKSSSEPDIEENEERTAHDLVEKLISSARYMDYQPIVFQLEEWRKNLDPHNGAGAGRQEAIDRLEASAAVLDRMIPQLEISSEAGPEPGATQSAIEEDDQELFSIFLDSFQQNFSRLAEVISGPGPAKINLERASELTESLIQSSKYMDYTQLVELLEEWNDYLSAFKDLDATDVGPLLENLANVGKGVQSLLSELKLPDFSVEKPEPSRVISLDDDIDFIFDTGVKPEKSDVIIEEPQALAEPAPDKNVQENQSFAPPAKTPGAHAGGKERTAQVVEESPQNAVTLRVDAQKVDQLLNQVGELVVNRSEFIQTATIFRDVVRDLAAHGMLPKQELRRLRLLDFRLSESTQSLGRIANDLQTSVMRVRMLPISQLFQRFPRIVRDQALKLGKKVELTIEGGETEIDKRVLEQMNDPLVQLLRNAIAHGIETPEERRKSGKPEVGSIRLTAYHAGDYVAIEIEDDGRGIDTDKLRELLLNRNAASQHELDRLSDAEIAYSIFMPGISTYEKVDGTAGRGVGLDVVKQNVERMNGTVEVQSYAGEGTRFLIRIPLTVAIIRALLVSEADQVFTLPLTSVAEILRHRPEDTYSIEGFRVITLRGKTIPLVDLGELLNMPDHQTKSRGKFVVIVATSFREVGLVVDGLMGEREVVIKSIDNNFQSVEGFSGATILGDGRVSLIADVSALLRMMKSSSALQHAAGGPQHVN